MKKIFFSFLLLSSIFIFGCSNYFGPGTADFNYELSGEYKLSHAGNNNTFIYSTKTSQTVIDADITGIAWNSDFILIEQSQKNTKNYWVIDINSNKIYGPLGAIDFKEELENLNVDTNLELTSPDTYKHLEKQLNS